MSRKKAGNDSLLPSNATIVELTLEPFSSLRLRMANVPRGVAPGNSVPVSDVIFAGIQALEISLDLRAKSSLTVRGSEVPATRDGTAKVELGTNMGSIRIACDAIYHHGLAQIPIVSASDR